MTRVVCEEKHMGSRAIAVIARDGDAAERRFGVGDGTTGTVYTRRQRAEATQWWLDLTTAGREGIVVKPADLIEGRVQPGLKVRGREYLRIIYGPDYTDSLDVLRDRQTGKKRRLAQMEHGLGLTALAEFVDHGPLWKVHQSVFAVLALESEPVDPRL